MQNFKAVFTVVLPQVYIENKQQNGCILQLPIFKIKQTFDLKLPLRLPIYNNIQ